MTLTTDEAMAARRRQWEERDRKNEVRAKKAADTRQRRDREHRVWSGDLATPVLEFISENFGEEAEERIVPEGILDPFGYRIRFWAGDRSRHSPAAHFGEVDVDFRYGSEAETLEHAKEMREALLPSGEDGIYIQPSHREGLPYWETSLNISLADVATLVGVEPPVPVR